MNGPVRGGGGPVVITGLAAVSALGRGTAPLLAGVLAGTPAFAPVRRFDVARRRVGVAAALPGTPSLADELAGVVDTACDEASLAGPARAGTTLLLAVHDDPDLARAPEAARGGHGPGVLGAALAVRCGLAGAARVYTNACVAASTAVADGAAMIAQGRAARVVVAAGYLVDADQFALFDAGRALAVDGAVRPFSTGRGGLLLGDGVAAVVLESAGDARDRGTPALAELAGWGRAGDAYHVCQPRPDGAGLARAISAALDRAGVTPADVGYINAHGSGTAYSDAAESAALHRALGPAASRVPVSSTKSVHGQALEASGLLELVVTVLALRAGRLPVNAGYLGPDDDCPLDLVLDTPREASPRYALSLNAAFGGANTALLVGAA